MKLRLLFCTGILVNALTVAAFAGVDEVPPEAAPITSAPFRFSGEFTVEQSFVGDSEVKRDNLAVDDFNESYTNLSFVYTPRVKVGILRLGAQFERYSFGFSNSGQQLPNGLQATNAIIGLDTEFSDSILVRFEAQPGFYGTTFDHFAGEQFNVPFVLGGTYIYSPELQLVFGIGVNVQQKYPVLPGGGIRWKFAPKWVLDAVLPTPRLEYNLSSSVTLYAGAEVKANTFRVDNHFGDSRGDTALNSAWLSYEELRTGLGLSWKLTSSLTLAVEGGYLPYRDFDYYRTDVRYHSEHGGAYGSLVFQGNF
ncbi:MAG TPA: DUF6268 family outer membrane beta-barrel protein [Chthoniobacterales bacterium]|nr:DUF6268 family outer membrane beta-barrel protein [Chthoniobacterales bacterium]